MSVVVRLSQFEGPLDLLLHLIHNAQISIADIFISEITAQYIQTLQQLEALDMETASEFIAMAATLLYIKSRSLLPRPKPLAEEEEDPEALLIRQLQAYEACKETATLLQARLQSVGRMYGKLPDELVTTVPEEVLDQASLKELFAAYAEAMLRDKSQPPQPAPREVVKDTYPITERISFVRQWLMGRKTASFGELLSTSGSRMERVSTLMAILEMLMLGQIKVEQPRPFEEIIIERTSALEALIALE